jgi:hypothetical protein
MHQQKNTQEIWIIKEGNGGGHNMESLIVVVCWSANGDMIKRMEVGS